MRVNTSRACDHKKFSAMGCSAARVMACSSPSEILARTHIDAIWMRACLVEDEGEGQRVGGASEHADWAMTPPMRMGAERAGQRAHAAYFDHQVHALAAGLVQRPAVPVWAFRGS